MPRADRAVILRLDSLRWDTIATPTPGHVADETPYVWTLFFRADGSTLRVTADAKVAGAAVVDSTPVSREDLGGHGISLGSSVTIPNAIGWWGAAVKPIPIDPSLQPVLGPDAPAQFGVIIVVLVQNGYLTDALARTGYQALVAFVEDAIATLIASLGPDHRTITQDDIDGVTAGAGAAVKSAIRSAASTWEEIKILFEGTDTNVGSRTLLFDQDQFTGAEAHLDIDEPVTAPAWQWSVRGSLEVVDTCPATALAALAGTPEAHTVLAAMRTFRDRDLAALPALRWWWDRASQHAAELAWLARSDRGLAEQLPGIFALVPGALGGPDHEVPAATLDRLRTAALLVARRASPLLRNDARQLATMLAALSDRRLAGVERMLDSGRGRVSVEK